MDLFAIVAMTVRTAYRPPHYYHNNCLHCKWTPLPDIVTITISTANRPARYCHNICQHCTQTSPLLSKVPLELQRDLPIIIIIVSITVSTTYRPPRYCHYCHKKPLILRIYLPVIVTITVNTTYRPPRYCHNNCWHYIQTSPLLS